MQSYFWGYIMWGAYLHLKDMNVQMSHFITSKERTLQPYHKLLLQIICSLYILSPCFILGVKYVNLKIMLKFLFYFLLQRHFLYKLDNATKFLIKLFISHTKYGSCYLWHTRWNMANVTRYNKQNYHFLKKRSKITI